MKKIILRTVVCLIGVLCATNAYAYKFSAANNDGKTIYYNINKDGKTCEVTHNDRNSYAGVLYVPETVSYNGTTYKVTAIGKEAFRECKDLLLVVLPNTIRTIGVYAFLGCPRLKSMEFPESVISIGKQAFENCAGLTRVKFGKYLQNIETKAFYGCGYLAYLTFCSPTKIGIQAFDGCEKLVYIYCRTTVPPTITKPESAFMYNVYRTSILFVPNDEQDNYANEAGWKFFRFVRTLK